MSEQPVVWISGGSSGIGAALVESVPYESARVINIARRSNPRAEHLEADLLLREAWDRVEANFRAVLEEGVERAFFLHCAGSIQGTGRLVTVTDVDAYIDGLVLNALAGPVLGRAFIAAAVATRTPATLMMCSSPASTTVLPGMSTYGAAKAAVEQWSRIAAAEMGDDPDAPRIFVVVPRAVDGEMIRETMDRSPEEIPLAGWFKSAAQEGALVPAADAAREIWSVIEGGVEQGAVVRVGLKDEDAEAAVDEQKRFGVS